MARLEELRTGNIDCIRRCFYLDRASWTRPALAQAAGLSMAGTENILQELLVRQEILAEGNAPSTGGRRSRLYRLNPDYTHAAVLALSHLDESYRMSLSVMDACREQLRYSRWTSAESPDTDSIASWVKNFLESDPRICCVMVSFPGIVAGDGMIVDSDFPLLSGEHFSERLAERLGVPVRTENDVNLAAEGYRREHNGCTNLAVLYQPCHDHAGAGVIVHGRLVRGHGGFAGEVGRPAWEDQKKLLAENPARLVQLQLEMLTAVAAPERIAWYCPLVKGTVTLGEEIPAACQPVLEQIADFHDLERLMQLGAEAAGMEEMMDCGRTGENHDNTD